VNEEYPIESPLYSIPSLIRSLRSSQACSISYLH
jgi:hypothetical protein